MDAQDIRNLQEAYLEVVSNNNELSEMSYKKLPVGKMMWKAVNRTEREADTRADREREANDPHSTLTYDRAREEHEKAEKNKERNYKMVRVADTHSKKEAKAKSKLKKEQVDLYDIILSHLINEGYAETPEQAEAIMVNMSENWRESIVEAIEGLRPASERMARGVLTSSQRASQKARARREEKKKEELEKAANAILNQIGGASRRFSAPMGSTPAPQKAEAPEANRRIKPRMKSDDLASAADKVLRGLR
jgi:hypothetical protein